MIGRLVCWARGNHTWVPVGLGELTFPSWWVCVRCGRERHTIEGMRR